MVDKAKMKQQKIGQSKAVNRRSAAHTKKKDKRINNDLQNTTHRKLKLKQH